MDTTRVTWRKSRRSGGDNGNCVELASNGAVRDSKDPSGPTLEINLGGLLAAVKAGNLPRC